MQWSRLKKMLESRLCERLVGRVQLHTARYTHDGEVGRIWLVLDKQEFFSVGDLPKNERPEWYEENGCIYFNTAWGRHDIEMLLSRYLEMSIEDALASEEAFVRALAMLDKRLGERRLHALAEPMKSEALPVRHFYALRCREQGLEIEI